MPLPSAAPTPSSPQGGPPLAARGLGSLLGAAVRTWIRHRAPSRGAALAFYTFFSLAPILVLATALAARMLGPMAARGELLRQLHGLLGPHLARTVQGLVLDTQTPGAGTPATLLATLLLAVGATSAIAELKDSLDEIWQPLAPPPTGLAAALRGRLLAFALVGILSLLLLASLALDGLLALLQAGWPGRIPPAAALSPLAGFGIITALFAVIFRMLPEVRPSWGDAALGAWFTALLFTAGRHFIGLYLARAAGLSAFGAAGSVAALLTWVYYSAQIFLLGAAFTLEYALRHGSLRGRGTPAS